MTFAVNLRTAKALGLTNPETLLPIADTAWVKTSRRLGDQWRRDLLR